VDVISIDGFECQVVRHRRKRDAYLLIHITGAGHPGEDDIGGLILVSFSMSCCCAFLRRVVHLSLLGQ